MLCLKRAVAALVCALTLSAAPTFAQSLPEPLQVRPQIDERGVDLITQSVQLAGLGGVSIGPDGPGGLSFSRLYRNGGWRNSLLASVSVSGTQAFVSIGDAAESFDIGVFPKCGAQPAQTYNSAQGVGTTLTVQYEYDCETTPNSFITLEYTYTDRNGVVYSFTTDYSGASYGTTASAFRPVSAITFPTGEVTTLHYNVTTVPGTPPAVAIRLQGVTNNLGYAMHFDYARNGTPTFAQFSEWRTLTKVTAFDATVVTNCAPLAETCAIPSSWPWVSYAGTEFRIDSTTDALGRTTTFSYNASSLLTGVRLPGTTAPANDIAYAYNASNILTSVTVNGATWNYNVSNSGSTRTLRIEGPLDNDRIVISNQSTGLITSDAVGATGNPASGGSVTSYLYDTSGRVQRVTAPESNHVIYAYDTRGNVTSTTSVAKPGSGLANIVTSATYPATCANPKTCNKPLTTTDALGRVTDYAYNATHGGLESVLAPAPASGGIRQRITYAYSQIAAVTGSVWRPTQVTTCATAETCAGSANEAKTTIAYLTGKVLPNSTSSGSGNGSLTATTSFTYTALGDVATVNGPLSGTTDQSYFFYDILRRQTGVIGPDPDGSGPLLRRALTTTFTARGLPDLVTQGTVTAPTQTALNNMVGLQRQRNFYDGFGRPAAVQGQHVSGSVFTTEALVQLNYDASSRPLCLATRLNGLTDTGGDACTPRTPGVFGNDRIARTNYDVYNRAVSTVRAFGTPAAITDAVTTYTPNGLVATIADGKGNKTTFDYDGFDRQKKTRFPVASPPPFDSSTTDFEELFYDAGSRIVSRRLRDGQTIGYTYDNRDRLTFVDIPGGAADDVTNAYDVMGRLTASGIPGQNQTFAWDMLGRLTSAVSPIGGVNKTVGYQYDLAGRNTRITYPTEGGVSLYVAYDYLVTGEMTELRENSTSVGVNVLAKYSYDNLGRRTALARAGGTAMTTTYSYFANDTRLQTLAHDLAGSANDLTLTFGWTPASQLSSRTASNDAYSWTSHYNEDLLATLNGLNQVTNFGGSIAYDNRGNLTADGVNTYSYDPQNRLIAATTPTGAASLNYDALGRLHEVAKGQSTARFLYSGSEIIAEYNGAGALQTRYVRGAGPDEVLVEYQGGTTLANKRWLIADERGSIVGGANSSGASQWKNAYDEYGRPSPTNQGRFQYTGQLWLYELNLYHYKARAYSPGLGRFLQTDPIGYSGGLNLYAYVGGDPVNRIDPNGLLTACVSIDGAEGECRQVEPPGGGFSGFGGGFSGSSGGEFGAQARDIAERIGEEARETIEFYCSQQPQTPPGVSVPDNIARLRQAVASAQTERILADRYSTRDGTSTLGLAGVKLGVFIAYVRTGSAFDYKNLGGSNPQYEPFGNFNFGAVGRSLGYSRAFLLQGAGAAQALTDAKRLTSGDGRLGAGLPLVKFPFGDALQDRAQIIAGINAFDAGCFGN